MKLFSIVSASLGLLALVKSLPVNDTAIIDACAKCGSISCLISKMSVRDKITQKMMPDIRNWRPGSCTSPQIDVTQIIPEIDAYLQKYKWGGLILFAQNVVDTGLTAALTDQLQKSNAQTNKIPLLISTDQEGGLVTRLGHGTMFPGNMAMCATRDLDNTQKAATIMAQELKAVGINVQFGPVSDVNINPQNPVIGVRSFSDDPNLVSANAPVYAKAVQEQGTISCAKHFPGHGDTATDSHFGLPRVDKTLAQWEAQDMPPFLADINAGIDMVMTAHIQYPNLDPTLVVSQKTGESLYLPATLSKVILNDILRVQLGFNGVIITDAMNMLGIVQEFGQTEAVGLSFKAGVDIVLMPAPVVCVDQESQLDDIINSVLGMIDSGDYTVQELDESVARILNLKKKYGLLQLDNTPVDQKVSNAVAFVNNANSKAIEKQMSNDAMTLLKNDASRGIPFVTDSSSKVLVFVTDATQVAAINMIVKDLGINVPVTAFSYGSAVYGPTHKAMIDGATHIIIGSQVTLNNPAIDGNGDIIQDTTSGTWAFSFPQAVVAEVNSQNKPLSVLSMRNPYDAANFPTAPSILCLYGVKGIVNGVYGMPNLPSAISTVFGYSKPKGILPVNVPALNGTILYPRGFGLTL
ncbi:Beta-hexosaminidase [Smittium mucronatum]|uniref:beta-N-acetylhexosaminidase n=1 Tax=Smittium mucronatum TaxID=133383 RepID=A0A1R0GQA3_9FUNG|nr:Beta-hexosaminidase [Smittium mucronatum]